MTVNARAYTRTIFPSAARIATVSSSVIQVPPGIRGVRIGIDATAETATASVVFSVEKQDPISSDWKTILDSAAVEAVTTGPTWMLIYPGAPVTANVSVNTPIGNKFRVTATHADADSLTYSVYCEFLP